MIFPHDYPSLLHSYQWDISFLWKKNRLRYLLDVYYDELIDKNFGMEADIQDPFCVERTAMCSIKPLYRSVVSVWNSITRVKEREL